MAYTYTMSNNNLTYEKRFIKFPQDNPLILSGWLFTAHTTECHSKCYLDIENIYPLSRALRHYRNNF